MPEHPPQPPEGALLERHVKVVMGTSFRKAADLVGMSDARLRQIANGYSSHGKGISLPVVAPADTLAKIAHALGISATDLAEAGRQDAANALAFLKRGTEPVGPSTDDAGLGTIKARKPANMSDEDFKRLLDEYQEEIEWKLNRAARER